MKRTLFLLVAVFVCVYTCLFAETAQKNLYELMIPYKSAVYTQTNGLNGTNDGKFHSKNRIFYKRGMVRIEHIDKDGKVYLISIAHGKDAYLINPHKKTCIKSVNNLNDKMLTDMIDCPERKNAIKKGNAKFNGENCRIYEYDYLFKVEDFKTNYKVTEYRNKDGFIMKSIWQDADKKDKGPNITEVSELSKNPVLNDSLFEPPKDYATSDVSWFAALAGGGDNTEKTEETGTVPEVKQTSRPAVSEKQDTEKVGEVKKSKENDEFTAEKVLENAAGELLKGLFGQ